MKSLSQHNGIFDQLVMMENCYGEISLRYPAIKVTLLQLEQTYGDSKEAQEFIQELIKGGGNISKLCA